MRQPVTKYRVSSCKMFVAKPTTSTKSLIAQIKEKNSEPVDEESKEFVSVISFAEEKKEAAERDDKSDKPSKDKKKKKKESSKKRKRKDQEEDSPKKKKKKSKKSDN